MAPACNLLTRRADTNTNSTSLSSNTVQIIGIAVACAIAGLAALTLAIYFWRKRLSARRERNRESAFLRVRGVVREGAEAPSGPGTPQMRHANANGFSRSQMTNSVIMSEYSVLHKDASREEIVDYYTAEGKLPRPFAPFAIHGNAPKRVSAQSSLRPASAGSFLSAVSAYSSRRASTASSFSTFDEGHKRKVRQLFHPTLPDELTLSLGERVAVVNSYDDGWCIIGRDSMFKPGEVELGAVPAWVFVKPVKGLKAERPIRTSSLGVTVTLDAPGGPRQDVISWSNF